MTWEGIHVSLGVRDVCWRPGLALTWLWFSGHFSPRLCSLTLVVACGLRLFCRVLSGTCFSFPFGRLSGFSGHPSWVFWVQSLWCRLCRLGLCGLVCRAGLLGRVCRSLSLASVFATVRGSGFLLCHPLSVTRLGVGLARRVVVWPCVVSSFVTVCLQWCSGGLGFCPVFPGVAWAVGFRFVGLALKVSFPATPNKFCLS